MTKPFEVPEPVARIGVQLRKASADRETAGKRLTLKDLVFPLMMILS